MIRSSAIAFAILCGCASTANPVERVYSPSEVLKATKELDGKFIVVRGWIGGCKPDQNRMCGLYSTKRAAFGPRPMEWPLPLAMQHGDLSPEVRRVTARGSYVVTCQSDEMTICLEYDGYFVVKSIEEF